VIWISSAHRRLRLWRQVGCRRHLLGGHGPTCFQVRQAGLVARPDLRHGPGQQRHRDDPEAILQALDGLQGAGGGMLDLTKALLTARLVIGEALF